MSILPEDPNRVLLFDTTLRDGEQSPGIALNAAEKLEIAQQLARLGVDIIEAGFPIASPGDFEAVQMIAREVQGPVICGLARANSADIDVLGGHPRQRTTSHPHVPVHLRHPHRAPAAVHARGRQGPRARVGRPGQGALRGRRVLADGRDALRGGVHRRGRPDRHRRGRDDHQHPRHRRLRDARRVRRVPDRDVRLGPGPARRRLSVHCHDDLGLAVANSLAGVQAGARQIECASTASASAPATPRSRS